jgi:hypothetical protein
MPPIIIVIAPAIIGNSKNGNETPPIITAIGLPPAGGWVIFKAIISIIEIPTANPIAVMLGGVSFQFLIFPVMVGTVAIIIGGIIYNSLILKRKYPVSWK